MPHDAAAPRMLNCPFMSPRPAPFLASLLGALLLVTAWACGPAHQTCTLTTECPSGQICSAGACYVGVSSTDGGQGGGTGTGGNTGTGGSTSTSTGGNSGSTPGPGSFGAQCGTSPTTLSGKVLAPNGSDPVPQAEIAVWATVPAPLARGVVCESCDPSGGAPLAMTTSALDGTFTLNLDLLPKQASYAVTVRKARFRTVHAALALAPCGDTRLTPAQATLPGKAADGDLPRIAVSSGTKDHLENVLKAMGITEYDCVKGLPASSTSETCTRSTTLGQLLADATQLDGYGLLFIACAPGDTYEPTSPTAAAHLHDWVARGGKLIVTDDSYDFVEQAFPDAVDFMAPAAAPGQAQTPNAAEVGAAAASLQGTVADQSLLGWLTAFPGAVSNGAVQLVGFLSRWAVMRGAGPSTAVLVHGHATWSSGGSGDVPLTVSFEVNHCGRVIFSSYHTDSGSTALKPQERILEYLMFQVGTCTTIN